MVGVPRLTPDYDALTMMNMILGGYYASRLNANLREKHGYTYAAQSSFDLRRGPGPFAAGATVASEHTGAALREIFHELARMREELVSQEELDDARTRSIRRLPARFETAIATAGTLSTLAVEGLPLDEFSTRPARFGKLTREDIRRVAATYLAPEALRVVVVGDGQVVKAQLAELGVGEVVVKSPPPPAKKAGEGKAAPRKAAPKR
jgi:predicted Zn-dependent peptidase